VAVHCKGEQTVQKKVPAQIDRRIGQEIVLVILGLIVVILTLLLAERLVIQPAFSQLEQQQIRQDGARIIGEFENAQLALAAATNDWANWDATYAFARDRNPRYFEENYPDPVVFSRKSRIDLLAIFDLAGKKLLQGVFLPSLNRPVSLQLLSGSPPGILLYLSPVVQRGEPLDGLLATEHGLLLISARPILPNSQQGPSRGVLIMGRFLSGNSLKEISERTQVSWNLFRKDDEQLTDAEKILFGKLALTSAGSQEQMENGYLYRILRDVKSAPVAMIRVTQRGEILRLGQQTGRILFILLSFSALGFLGFLSRYRTRMMQYINALQQTERQHRDSEELFRNIVTSSPMGMHFYRFDSGNRLIFTEANPAADRILGIDHRPLFGKTIEEAFPKLQGTHIPELYAQVARGEKGLQFFEVPYDDGKITGFFEVYVSRTGRNGVVATYLDVSERKKTEAALLDIEARYSRALAATTDAIWEWDLITDRTFFSPRWYEMLGYADQEMPMTFATWKNLCHPDDYELAAAQIQATLKNSGSVKYRAEFRMRAKSGEWRWILGRGDVTKHDDQGKPLQLVGTHVDITDHKIAEEILWQERQNLRAILHASPLPTLIFDADERVIDANRAAEELFHRSLSEVSHCRCGDFLSCVNRLEDIKGCGNSQKCPECLLARAIRESFANERGVRDCETRVFRKDDYESGELWLQFSTEPFEIDGQQRLIVVLNDITERKKAEVTAVRERLFSDDVINSLPGIFYMYDEQSKLVRWNKRHEEVTGYTANDLAGRMNLDFFAEEHRERVAGAVQTVFIEGSGYVEAPLLLKDGSQVPYFFTGHLAMIEGGQYLLGLGIDISERKHAEEERESLQAQLLQAQKMESVGRLAGGVAHDFNNMLSVIIGYSELSLLQIDAKAPFRKHLEQIRSAAERSVNLTQQLLAFARKQTIAPRLLDLNETVAGMLKMLRRLIGEEIDLSWQPGAGLWSVMMDPSQIDQILVNLCVNARDAIAGVGKISIETANITFDETYCLVHEGFVPGDHVSLIVSDTGCGMDKETIRDIFEPFFTTKKEGQGTGLGLAMVYGIVKQNNASINVYSEPGKGTAFKIYLPRAVNADDEVASVERRDMPLSRGETVLLVEDEWAIMEMARTMLSALNYGVLVATSPEEAIRLASEYEGPIDLLLTDVVMPKMNGRQLQEILHGVRPVMRCLFMSGYTADVIAHQGVLDEGLNFIQKPFSMQTLAIRVREVLDRE
jgi:PAS domain S-box-containing protein